MGETGGGDFVKETWTVLSLTLSVRFLLGLSADFSGDDGGCGDSISCTLSVSEKVTILGMPSGVRLPLRLRSGLRSVDSVGSVFARRSGAGTL